MIYAWGNRYPVLQLCGEHGAMMLVIVSVHAVHSICCALDSKLWMPLLGFGRAWQGFYEFRGGRGRLPSLGPKKDQLPCSDRGTCPPAPLNGESHTAIVDARPVACWLCWVTTLSCENQDCKMPRCMMLGAFPLRRPETRTQAQHGLQAQMVPNGLIGSNFLCRHVYIYTHIYVYNIGATYTYIYIYTYFHSGERRYL